MGMRFLRVYTWIWSAFSAFLCLFVAFEHPHMTETERLLRFWPLYAALFGGYLAGMLASIVFDWWERR